MTSSSTPHPPAEASTPAAGLGPLIEELLTDPERAAGSVRTGESALAPLVYLGVALVSLVCYGFGSGAFQGGATLLLAAWKTPLIVFGSVALCAPSLFVFSALAGSRIALRGFLVATAGFTGVLGLVMLALVPVIWLFSATSRSLGFVVVFHLVVWLVALSLAHRHLRALLRGGGGADRTGPWGALLFVVALQMATYLRPVIERRPGDEVFDGRKKFFLEQFGDILNGR